MKFNTEITTRNWNNGWVDVNVRMPKDDTDCFILYRLKTIIYDDQTLQSKKVESFNGMGDATYKDGKWSELRSCIHPCETCDFGGSKEDAFDLAFCNPTNPPKPSLFTNDGKECITLPDYEVLEQDYFEFNPCVFKQIFKYDNHEKRSYHHSYIQSSEVEILAWCSYPDDPVNPFEEEEKKDE